MSLMTICNKFKLGAALAACVVGALGAAQASADTLRVCADPDNLPFSKAEGSEHGMYVDLAELVAKRLGSSVDYVWWLSFNQRKALRNTIMDDGCDAYFALPADADYKLRGLQRTRSFIDVSYALVAAPGFTFNGLSDLKGKRIAVIHGSPPHILLARNDGYTTTSFLDLVEALKALDKGEVDAALLWGPSAGYEAQKRFAGRWQLTPVTGEGLTGQMAVAVRKSKEALTASIDKALVDLTTDIQKLAEKYGFPTRKSVPLVGTTPTTIEVPDIAVKPAQSAMPSVPAATPAPASSGPVAQPVATAVPVAAAGEPNLAAGRSRFNDVCSHCHGTNGASPVSERDLRRLKARYHENWQDTAITTIKNGRPDAGMPTWKEVYSDKDISELLAFLSTIQK